jgi:hypothetical protein
MIDKKFIDDFMRGNKQKPAHPEDSELWQSIQKGFNCTAEEAQYFAASHCNSMSFYALCMARGFIDFPYSTWCSLLVDNGYMTKKGYLEHTKIDVAKFFDFNDRFTELKYCEDYEDAMDAKDFDPEKGYNIKVHSNSGVGFHFMSAYVEKEKLYLSDSGSRGIKVEARSVIPKEKFLWTLEV